MLLGSYEKSSRVKNYSQWNSLNYTHHKLIRALHCLKKRDHFRKESQIESVFVLDPFPTNVSFSLFKRFPFPFFSRTFNSLRFLYKKLDTDLSFQESRLLTIFIFSPLLKQGVKLWGSTLGKNPPKKQQNTTSYVLYWWCCIPPYLHHTKPRVK